MRIQLTTPVALALAIVLASMGTCAWAEVIYRETFGRPGAPAPTGNLPVQQWDWAQFTAGGAVHAGGNVNGTNEGRPVDVANTPSAGPNNDGTFDATPWGWHYFDGGTTAPGARALSMTTEYSFNPADYGNNLKFSWWQANGNAAGEGTTLGGFQVAVRQGGAWYASTQVFNNTVNNDGGGAGVNPNAELMEFLYNPAASNWLTLNFDGNYTLGATPGTGTATASSGPISLGGAPASALSGPITAFGLYRATYLNNSRMDTFTIESSGPPPLLGDTDGNGVVNLADFEPIRANFRKPVSLRSEGDLVPNGVVDFDDFRQWKTAFLGAGGSLAGVDLSFSASVPEPATCGLMILAAGFAAVQRARSHEARLSSGLLNKSGRKMKLSMRRGDKAAL